MKLRTILAEMGVNDPHIPESLLERDVIVAGGPDVGACGGGSVDVLSLASLETARPGKALPGPGELVLVHCGDEVPDELRGPREGILAFSDPRPFPEVRAAFDGLPARIALLDSARERLFRAFRASYDLGQFAQRAYETIGNPLMIVNADRRLLASAGDFPAERQDVLDEIHQGYVSEEVNAQMEADGVIEDVRRAHHAIISDNPRFGQRWVTAIITYHHLELGRFDVLESDRHIGPLDLELIDFGCSLAGIMIDRLGLSGESAGSGSSVLADLLSNSFSNERTMRAQLSLTGLPLDDAYVLIAVQGAGLADADYHKRVARLVSRALGRSLWTVQDGLVVLLLPVGRTRDRGFDGYGRAEELLGGNQELAAALENNGLTACVSEPFEQLSFAASRLAQCKALTECSDAVAGTRVRYFWRLRFEALAANAPSFEQVDMMLDKRVVAMRQYDEEHGTQYFDTAVMSVHFPGSPAEVAHVLNVHRNTYFYRVNKIRELFYLDLKDGDDRLAVSFSARVMGGMGERLHVMTDAARA